MKAAARISLEVLGPPFFVGVFLWIVLLAPTRALIALILVTYYLGLAPSVIYTVLIEVSFACGLKKDSAAAVAVSSVIALFIGAATMFIIPGSEPLSRDLRLYISVVLACAIAGATVSIIIRRSDEKKSEKRA
jgi:hypothetical protein